MGLLRFLLAISVVTAHCGLLFGKIEFVGGEMAVQSFFIISGFYMSLVLDGKYSATSNFKQYKLFISNRLLRLYPVYWMVLCLTIIVFAINYQSKLSNFNLLNLPALLYLIFTNIFIFFQDIILFLGINVSDGSLYFTSNFQNANPQLHHFLLIPQGWSLGIELLFYLIAPILVKQKTKLIVWLILFSLLLRIYTYQILQLNHDPWTYRFFPTELVFFLIGIIVQRQSNTLINLGINASVLLIIIGLMTFLYAQFPSVDLYNFPFSLKSIIYFGLIALSIPILFDRFKDQTIDRKIGELSYPIYISHMFVYFVTRHSLFSQYNSGSFVILFIIIFSMVLVKYISEPIEKLRQSRIKQSKTN